MPDAAPLVRLGTITHVRVAIFADVHGNLPALEAVLDDLGRQDVDRVIINGDSVNRGPQSAEVARLLAGFPHEATLGNHDDLMVMVNERDPSLGETLVDPFWSSTRMTAASLAPGGFLEAVKTLPMTLRIELPGAPSVLVSHGSPRHYREGYGPALTSETISEIVEEYPADVFVGSHTHRPHLQRWARYTVINTGSVGAPFNGDPRAQYLILTLTGGAWEHEFRRVPYDLDEAVAAYADSGLLEEGGLSAHIFRDELAHARSYIVPFLMRCEEGALERTWEGWEAYKRMRPERFVPPVRSVEIGSSTEP